jgi:predicted dehydrogenase
MDAGLIGCGYWGKNLIRNFYNSQEFFLKKAADINLLRLREINANYPSIETTNNTDDILNDDSIELIIVSTPVKTHYEFVKKALLKGKHVLVEKPMTPSFKQAKELVILANKYNRQLIIDYTYLYSGAVRKIKELHSTNALGAIKSIVSSRLGKGIIRDDVSVFWDLSSHDLSITNYILNKTPIAVKAAMTSLNEDITNEKAVMTVYYPDQTEAEFECSWFSSTKERRMAFYGLDKTIFYDDTLEQNKIKIVDNALSSYPTYDTREALSILVSDLFKSLENNNPSLSDCSFGLDIIKVLEAAQYSLENNGELIQLQQDPRAIMLEGI